MNTTDNKADWPLLRVVNEVMKPSGRYKPHRIRQYRSAVRKYELFRNGEQSAGEVTVRLLEKFQESLTPCGAKEAATWASMIGSIVRQADPDLLPNRNFGEFSGAETGNLLYILENEYYPSRSKIASPKTELQYKWAVTRYSQHLGRHATLNDLTDLAVGKWMRAMRNEGLAAITINGYLNKIRAFWTWLAKKRIVELFPTIDDFPEPAPIPDAWTEEQMKALLAATSQMCGSVDGVPAGMWWAALIRLAFDSGERTSALLALRWEHFDADCGTMSAPAEIRKGGRKPMTYQLKAPTIAAIDAIRSPKRKLIFAFPESISTFYNRYKKLLKLAGLPYVPRRSAVQKVRRTFASHIEARGGNATAALAHTARRVTERAYLDPKIIKEPPHNERLFDL